MAIPQAPIYFFAYELHPPLLRDTKKLVEEIKSFEAYAQCFDKAWLIATSNSFDDINQRLQQYLKPEDGYLLIPFSQYRGSLPQAIWDWITNVQNPRY